MYIDEKLQKSINVLNVKLHILASKSRVFQIGLVDYVSFFVWGGWLKSLISFVLTVLLCWYELPINAKNFLISKRVKQT